VGAYPQGKDFDIKTGTDIEYNKPKKHNKISQPLKAILFLARKGF
jgi:uncharacterized protein YjlB